MKKISVIIPVYKVEAYIADTIKSLINQSFKDFELIIVDDGSPDQSAGIAESLLSKTDIDYYVIHTENHGVSAARNTGLEIATSEYIIMVDGDDVLSSDFLQTYIELMQRHPAYDVYSSSFTIFTGDKVIQQPKQDKDVVMFSTECALIAFHNRNPRFLLPTLLLSKNFINQNRIRFDESVRYSEDVQFIWRVLAHNKKDVIHSSYSGYKYILHPGSTMTASGVPKILTWCNGFEKLYKEIYPLLPNLIKDTFAPSSYFAMLHGVAKMTRYSSFKEIYVKSECREHLHMAGKSVSSKVKFVSKITTMCPYLGYIIMKSF